MSKNFFRDLFDRERNWQKQAADYRPVSGRLKMVEEAAPYTQGHAAGMLRLLCLCACGATKVVFARDIRTGRARSCGANCRSRLDIRQPHRVNQIIYRRKTGRLVRVGPPRWDPALRKGVFAEVME
jgi:hypothetical protein